MSNINEALGVEETPTKKKSESYTERIITKGKNSAEKVIVIVAYAALIFGILGSLTISEQIKYSELKFFVFILGVVSSVITWAFIMVVANISNNIRQIRDDIHNLKRNA